MTIVKVHRWLSEKDKITYTFGSKEIPMIIFPDDTVNKALTKIYYGISEYHKEKDEKLKHFPNSLPYAWTNRNSLRFESEYTKLNPNIWKSKTHKSSSQSQLVKYKDDSLFLLNDINIVFKEDLPKELQENKFYFPDSDISWKPQQSYEELIQESKFLSELLDNSKEEKDPSYTFLKVRFLSVSNPSNTTQSTIYLEELFSEMNTSLKIPFLQLIEDSSKILYKVYKNHIIPPQLFEQWTNYDKIPKLPSIIGMFPIIKRNTYARVSLDNTGQLVIFYSIDSRDKIDWDIIIDHANFISKWFEKYLQKSIKIGIESITLKADYHSREVSVKDFLKYTSKASFISLYHNSKEHNSILDVIFKRSANYKSKIDIADYISSRLRLRIPIQDITDDLINLGMSQSEVNQWIENYAVQSQAIDVEEPQTGRKKGSINSTGCILRITSRVPYLKIQIENIASLDEINRITNWLKGTLAYIRKNKQIKPNLEHLPIKPNKESKSELEPEPETKPKVESKSSSKSSIKPEDEDEELLKGDIDLEFSGGSRYFLTRLQQLEPRIFLDTKNYARKCAANDNKQPVILTPDEKDAMDKSGYNAYDNSILYGSDQNKKNYYMCPRIWCPESKFAITDKELEENKGKCPGPIGESPMLMYDKNYWNRDYKIPHYIGFAKNPSGVCLPCCGKKPPKKEELNACLKEETKPVKPVSEKSESPSKSPSQQPTTPTQPTKPTPTKPTQPSIPTPTKPTQPTTPIPTKPIIVPVPKPDSKSKPEVKEKEKDETYIIGAPAPIDKDRYGVIPKDLHYLLQPNISYQLCSKTINRTDCIVRHGIQQDDTLMNAIAYALNKTKKELIIMIKDFLDPLLFITIDKGHLLQSFIEILPIIPDHKLSYGFIKEWKKWIRNYPKYIKMLNLSKYVQINENTVHNLDENEKYILSRELCIYKAYLNFFSHLKSNNPKNPLQIIELFQKYNYVIILWHKTEHDSATVQCPYYSSVKEILRKRNTGTKMAMILEDKGYYEPLELKQKGKDGVTLFMLKNPITSNVFKMLIDCDNHIEVNKSTEKLINIDIFSELYLNNAATFKITTIILRPDLQIYGFLTQSNILLLAPKEGFSSSIIYELQEVLDIKHIVYQDDINYPLKINEIFEEDLKQFIIKLKSSDLGMGIQLGQIEKKGGIIISSDLIIPKTYMFIPPIIPVRRNDDFEKYSEKTKTIAKKWFSIQHSVGKVLLDHYETLVKPLLKFSRKKIILTLINTFLKNPNKDIIQVVLEEIPLYQGKEGIAKWIRNIGLDLRSQVYYSNYVQDSNKNKEWVFSQNAVETGLPKYVIVPYSGFRPSIELGNDGLYEYDTKEKIKLDKKIPELLKKDESIELKKLPSKWTVVRNSEWENFLILKKSSYEKTWIPELFEWIAEKLHISLSWKEVLNIRFKHLSAYISELYLDKNSYLLVLEDPLLLKLWNKVLKKSNKNAEDIWKTLSLMNNSERIKKWKELYSNYKNELLWPMDIDISICSKLLNCNILVIFNRIKHGETVDEKRSNIENLYKSSQFFYNHNTKNYKILPFIILYKIKTKDYNEYYALIHNKNDEFLYDSMSIMPDEINKLVDFHLDHNQSKV